MERKDVFEGLTSKKITGSTLNREAVERVKLEARLTELNQMKFYINMVDRWTLEDKTRLEAINREIKSIKERLK